MHKRILASIGRRGSQENGDKAIPNGDSPEASVARGVRLFCESGGPNNSGEEVLHLPVIVENAESSPAAATKAALEIRQFLSTKNFQRAYVQYNAIMLMRILADNPGKSFTKNIDQKFVTTMKELLREGRDMSVQQILRETLDSFETDKANDETLTALREMWKKEKAKVEKRGSMAQPVPRNMVAPAWNQQQQQNYFARNHKPRGLPSPAELAQRIEEARTSAKLLSQVVQSTPPNEILGNELIKEFVERCQSASRSIQSYIHSDNPPPDEDTLLTLIETNDQIAASLSRHQHSLLQARKAIRSPSPQPLNPHPYSNGYNNGLVEAPSNPPSIPQSNNQFAAPQGPPPGHQMQNEDPFGDHNESYQPAGLQDPLAPQGYGLPPTTMSNESQQPSAYSSQPAGGHSRQVSALDDEDASYGANRFQPVNSGQPGQQQQQQEKPRYRF